MVVPLPLLASEPAPLMALATVTVSLRLKTRAPSFRTRPPPRLPVVPPLPIWSVLPPPMKVAVL